MRLIGVQHHHAHLAACLAEHGESGTAVGAIFDGTGYGVDGTVWGGELLLGDLAGFERAGHLLGVRLPGGARAIQEPWRMACAWLGSISTGVPVMPGTLRGAVAPRVWEQVWALSQTGPNSPFTTSIGRLFDAVAALCGVRASINYEGQAAIELEAACDPGERGSYPIAVSQGGDGELVIDPRETVAAVCADVEAAVSPGAIASRFHAAVADATVRACSALAQAGGVDAVVLSGGVFQNRRLLQATAAGLRRQRLRVLIPQRLPAGDGGISYGQAAVAARRLADGG